MMNLEQLTRESQHLLLKCISGSRAYNLALPTSDTDIKGIFVLPRKELYGLTYIPQVSNESNDEVYFELGRFVDLLVKNNPNILELLNTPASGLLYRHPLMDRIRSEDFLSKLCLDTFAGYAKTQMKKARGLNKRINHNFDRQRKSITDFCHVVVEKGTLPLRDWLIQQQFEAADCGLVNLAHFRDAYLLYHKSQLPADTAPKGIVSDPDANDVLLSSIPAGIPYKAILHFNKGAYSIYSKEYASWWQWSEGRNEARYQNTLARGKNYDAKNMMHTFRLLNMAAEIAKEHRVNVYREDRDFLLRVRNGEFEYETLVQLVEEKMEEIENLYAASSLPDAPDLTHAENLLVQMREAFY